MTTRDEDILDFDFFGEEEPPVVVPPPEELPVTGAELETLLLAGLLLAAIGATVLLSTRRRVTA